MERTVTVSANLDIRRDDRTSLFTAVTVEAPGSGYGKLGSPGPLRRPSPRAIRASCQRLLCPRGP